MISTPPKKPFGRKAYGSIPHLPGSRIGPGDHHCHVGQSNICNLKPRDRHDRIIVTEKLDGTNVAVGNWKGQILALQRKGYLAETSPYEMHHLFAAWVVQNIDRLRWIPEGAMLHGEWLAQAHGTIYKLTHEPFVAFDLSHNGSRFPWDYFVSLCKIRRFITPAVISDGPPLGLEDMQECIQRSAHGVASGESVEGAVYRVERRGEFDFMAKWVRPDKVDGKYLPKVSEQEPVWNWRP